MNNLKKYKKTLLPKIPVLVGQALQILAGFACVKLFTNQLNVNVYAELALFVNFCLFSSIPVNALEQGLIKSYHDHKTPEINYFASILILYLPFAGLISLLWFFFKTLEGVLVLFLFMWASISKNLLTMLLTHQHKYKISICLKSLDPIIRALLFGTASALFLNSQASLLNFAKTSYAIASLSIVILSLLVFDKRMFSIKSFVINDFLNYIWFGIKFSYPLMLWSIFGFAVMYSPMWMFSWAGLTESVSLFNVFYFISALGPSVLVTFISVYYVPKYYSGEIKSICFILKGYCFLILCGGLLLSFGSFYIVSIVSSLEYAKKDHLMLAFYLANGAFYLAQIINFRFFKENRTLDLLLPNIISGIAAVGFAWVGVRLYGEAGGVAAFLVSNILYLGLTFLKCQKIFRQTVV